LLSDAVFAIFQDCHPAHFIIISKLVVFSLDEVNVDALTLLFFRRP